MKYLYSILFLSLFLISGYAQTPKSLVIGLAFNENN